MAHKTFESSKGSPSGTQEFKGRGAAHSLPNSQDSSFNHSSNSRQSQNPVDSPPEEPVLSNGTHLHGAITPSTSMSNKSSQEIAGMEVPSMNQDATPSPEAESANAPVLTQPYHAFSSLHNERTGAPKRMANGEFKGPSLPTSPVDASQYGHSRNSSRTSRGSQISDLSSQLRTRLSYAMVKVQNGWQSHNINELEFMTSNQPSPTSATLDQRRSYDSFVTNGLSVDRNNLMQPSGEAMIPRDYDSTLALKPRVLADGGDTRDPQGDYATPTQIGASYESFWREHEGSSTLRNSGAKSPPSGGPSLAPPVDIIPRNARRAGSGGRQPPPIHTRGLHTAGGQAPPVFSTLPATPPPKKTPKLRTPSQQAAVEKDAVETLLFMSSPGNSGYHPPVTLSGTPLRSGFAPQASETDHLNVVRRLDGRSAGADAFLQQTSRPKKQLSDAEIDKMLDEMPETSSSDDNDFRVQHPLPLSGGK